MINGLDLFSGIGGISLALSPWVRTVAYCEIDKHACGVLLSRMANGQLQPAPIWDDVVTLRSSDIAEPIDIITGGFPCQDISLAGSRLGLAGERSGLYREVIRLVGELRPRFVFLENVAAIRRSASVVVGDLAAIGYDCRWTTFAASDIGAPHRRDRWWLLAANADGLGLWQLAKRHQLNKAERGDAEHFGASLARPGGQAVADPNCGGCASLGSRHDEHGSDACGGVVDGCFALRDWQEGRRPFPAIRRVDDGLRGRVDRLRALGNAVVPAQARRAFVELMGL